MDDANAHLAKTPKALEKQEVAHEAPRRPARGNMDERCSWAGTKSHALDQVRNKKFYDVVKHD